MNQEQAFQCTNCQSQARIQTTQPAPECCGQPMQSIPLDQCTLASTAEHSRLDSDDEPCDDGRSGG